MQGMQGTKQCLHPMPLRRLLWVVSAGGAWFHHSVIFPFPSDTQVLEAAVTQAPS